MERLRAGDLTLLEQLGCGSSGEVWSAGGLGRDPPLAVKISHPSERHSHEDVAFQLEYTLHSSLRHPGIVRAYSLGTLEDGRRFYTMDFVPSIGLDEATRRGGLEALGDIAIQVAQALDYAHSQGILHGDLKPGNILIAPGKDAGSRDVRVCDFGMARALADSARRRVEGTPRYFAPEILRGAPPDPRWDLYALGVTLGAALGATCGDEAWSSLVRSMTATSPAERPSSAAEVVERLTSLVSSTRASATWTQGIPIRFASDLTFVARGAELEDLERTLRERGGARTVLLHGDEGVGKTRLAEELVRRVELAGGRVVRLGSQGDAWQGALPRSEEWGRCDGLGAAVSRRSEISKMITPLLLEDDAARPTLFLCDPLEWAREDEFGFLRCLPEHVQGTTALLLVTGRTRGTEEIRSELLSAGAREIRLHPLDAAQTREMVCALLGDSGFRRSGGAVLPVLDDEDVDDLAEWVTRHAGGNPRRIRAALDELHERGVLRRTPRGWSVERASLRTMRDARSAEPAALDGFDTLSLDDRRIAELAASLGPEFDATLLERLMNGNGSDLGGFLARAIRSGLIREAPLDRRTYRFSSSSWAEVIAARIAPGDLASIHRRVIELVEREPVDRACPETLARHLEGAGLPLRAAELHVAAARKNRARGALRGAARGFLRAWELLPSDARARIPDFAPEWIHTLHLDGHLREGEERAAEILRGSIASSRNGTNGAKLSILRGLCLSALGERDPARSILAEILHGETSAAEPALEAWALAEYGAILLHDGSLEEAKRILKRARELAVAAGDARTAGSAAMRLGVIAWREDEHAESLDWHMLAREALSRPGCEDLLPGVWSNLATVHLARLNFRESIHLQRRAAEGYARFDRRVEAARSHQNSVAPLLEAGLLPDAEAALHAADRWGRRLRAPREESHFAHALAHLALLRGQLQEAAAQVNVATERAQVHGEPYPLVAARTLGAQIEIARGRFDEAARLATTALGESRSSAYRWGIAMNSVLLGKIADARGDKVAALARFEEALAEAERGRVLSAVFRTEAERAVAAAGMGELDLAERSLQRCRELQERSESMLWKGLLAAAEGRVHLAAERPDAGCRSLTRASEIFAGLGADTLRTETLFDLARGLAALGNENGARATWTHACVLAEQIGSMVPPCPFPLDGHDRPATDAVKRALEIAAAVSSQVTRVHSIEKVLETILDVAVAYLGAERGVLALADRTTGRLEVRLARNMDPQSVPDTLEISRSAISSVAAGRGIIATGDALLDPALGIQESVRRLRIRSLVAAPIRRGSEVIGALYLDHRETPHLFRDGDVLFVEFIAEMAAIGIHNARTFESALGEADRLRSALEDRPYSVPGTIYRAVAMRRVVERAAEASRRGGVILLLGPTGAGKDHMARVIHHLSGRRGSFVHCPLPLITEALGPSQLFGIRGRVATEVDPRPGFIEQAQDGTLFLNEIADASVAIQASLLQLLEESVFERLGEEGRSRKLNALVICATNADLRVRMEEGTFRRDLYYRIAGRTITLPPLRERGEDIPDFVEHFLDEWARESGRRVMPTPRAMELLVRCPWEGNVRELRTCIMNACESARNGVIDAEDLSSPTLATLGSDDGLPSPGIERTLDLVLIENIRNALAQSCGIVSRAASMLRVPESTLRRWIVELRLTHLTRRRWRRTPTREA